MLDTEDAKDIAGRLPQRSHCYDPGVAFAVDNGLDNVRNKSEGEEDGEEVCGSRVWAKAWPFSFRICLSWAAAHCEARIEVKSRAAEMIFVGM